MPLEFEFVLPCYNEARSLNDLTKRIAEVMTNEGIQPGQGLFVLVNNGSTDQTSEVLAGIKDSAIGHFFRIFQIEKNQGYGFGLWQGLNSTTAPIVGWSHADLQTDPADLFRAMKQLKSANTPLLVKGHRLGRNPNEIFVSRVFARLASVILGAPFDEINAQPKVFYRDLLNKIPMIPFDFAFDIGVLFFARKAGLEIQEIKTDFPPRKHGSSHWSSTLASRYKSIIKMIFTMFSLRLKYGGVKA